MIKPSKDWKQNIGEGIGCLFVALAIAVILAAIKYL